MSSHADLPDAAKVIASGPDSLPDGAEVIMSGPDMRIVQWRGECWTDRLNVQGHWQADANATLHLRLTGEVMLYLARRDSRYNKLYTCQGDLDPSFTRKHIREAYEQWCATNQRTAATS